MCGTDNSRSDATCILSFSLGGGLTRRGRWGTLLRLGDGHAGVEQVAALQDHALLGFAT